MSAAPRKLLLPGSLTSAQTSGWRGEGVKGGGASRVSSADLTEVISLPLNHLRDIVCVWWQVLRAPL